MKIAILTQPLQHNYGGIMQAYAMQQVLRQMGHQTVTLNRRNNYPSVKLFLLRVLSVIKCIIRKFVLGKKDIRIMNPLSSDYRTYDFGDQELKSFIREHIPHTQPLRGSKALTRYVTRHHQDAIIVGSDQVWRQGYSPHITDYFLSFLPEDCDTKRIAYAASFGTSQCDISSQYLNECIKALHRFNAVSVRENTGKEILKSLFMTDAPVVPDPTLLLSKEDYEILIDKKEKDIHPGMTYYILDEEEDKMQIVDDASKSLGLPRTRLSLVPQGGTADHGQLKLDSPSHWLSSIAYADFIVTDSFHGCVFSIIFNKPFIAIANKDRGLDRFHTLLNRLGLENRLVFSFKEYQEKEEQLLTGIDYANVNSAKEKWASAGRNFLVDALNMDSGLESVKKDSLT